MSTCLNCNGTGVIITCWDDLCANSDHCIHGDGEEICPECDGEGDILDEEDSHWDDDEPVCSYCRSVIQPGEPQRTGDAGLPLCPDCYSRLYSARDAADEPWVTGDFLHDWSREA